VVVQISLAVTLLIAAGLVVRSFINLNQVPIGFDATNVLTMEIEPLSARSRQNEWFSELIERVEALPGVASAGAVFLRPLAHGAIGMDVTVILEGQPDTLEAALANPRINHQVATPGYFRAMRIALLRGRLFDERDRHGAPRVVVIGERAAERLFPGQNPIGKRLSTPNFDPAGPPSLTHTVIGVVSDVHYRGIGDPRLDLYEPAAQSSNEVDYLVVRTTGDPVAIAAAVETQVRTLDRRAVVSRVATLEGIVSNALASWRFSGWLFTLFALVAFVLALVGLVSVVSLDVAHRSREFAVRMAVGADARQIGQRVVATAAGRAAWGIALGLVMATGGVRAMRTLLFEVDPLDPSMYALVAAIVCVAVVAAAALPARRAASIDPLTLLRRD
jgi:putative ABC transport system permease protein